jgi:molecular chaperone GrpE
MSESIQKPKKNDQPESEQLDGFAGDESPAGRADAGVSVEGADSSPADEAKTANGERGSVSERIARLQRECDEFRDQALRSRADFANYQKRTKQQADADRAFAVSLLARDLLEPIDNLERAIEALRSSGDSGVTAGLDMVQRQLLDILAKHGVEPIPAQGQPFDPNFHDAVRQQPSLEYPAGTVISELTKGYKIRERVLRPSKVVVSAKPSAS